MSQPSRQEPAPVIPSAMRGQTASFGPLPLFPFRLRRFVPAPSCEGTNHLQQKGKNNMNKAKTNPEEPKAAPMYQNEARLAGFLGRDPEVNGNRAVLSLATQKSWKPEGSTKWESVTEWHRIVVWDKLVEAVKPLAKGDNVLVQGELRSGSFEKELPVIGGGTTVVPMKVWEIKAREVRKLDRAKINKPKTAKAAKAAA
jgi:hypothetical protein